MAQAGAIIGHRRTVLSGCLGLAAIAAVATAIADRAPSGPAPEADTILHGTIRTVEDPGPGGVVILDAAGQRWRVRLPEAQGLDNDLRAGRTVRVESESRVENEGRGSEMQAVRIEAEDRTAALLRRR